MVHSKIIFKNGLKSSNYIEINVSEDIDIETKIQEYKSHNMNLYEVFNGKVKPYYEADIIYKTDDERKKNYYNDFKTRYMALYTMYKQLYPNNQFRIHCFDASGYSEIKQCYKNSFHFRISGVGYVNNGLEIPFSNEWNEDTFDTGVYKKTGSIQSLRIPLYSDKVDSNGKTDNRYLKPIYFNTITYEMDTIRPAGDLNPVPEYSEYLVSYIENENEMKLDIDTEYTTLDTYKKYIKQQNKSKSNIKDENENENENVPHTRLLGGKGKSKYNITKTQFKSNKPKPNFNPKPKPKPKFKPKPIQNNDDEDNYLLNNHPEIPTREYEDCKNCGFQHTKMISALNILYHSNPKINYNSYNEWIQVMMCLRNATIQCSPIYFSQKFSNDIKDIDNQCFYEFAVAFSQINSDKFDDKAEEYIYGLSDKFNENGYNIPWFISQLSENDKNHSDIKYIQQQYIYSRIDIYPYENDDTDAIANEDYQYALYFDELIVNNDYIAYEDEIYEFNGVYWKSILKDIFIQKLRDALNMLRQKVVMKINAWITYYSNGKLEDKNIADLCSDREQEYKKRLKKTQSMFIRKFGNQRGLLNILDAWVSYNKNQLRLYSNPFDKNPYLIAFENKVFDFKTMQVRDGCKKDMISKSVGYDWIDDENDNEDDKQELNEVLNQIMPIEEERNVLLRALGSGMIGKTVENIFILTGSGRNGKDTLITGLYKAMLGNDMFYRADNTVITEKTKGGINVSVANMNNKRCVLYNEPDADKCINVSLVKELTGGDAISARTLYSKNTDVCLRASHFIMCNKKPLLDAPDDAIANRLIIIPFRAVFKTEENLKEMGDEIEYAYPVNTKFKSDEFKSRMRLPLFKLLIEHIKQFMNDGEVMTNIPESIQALSREYLSESSKIGSWFIDNYDKTENENDFIQIKDMFNSFKMSDQFDNMTKKDKRNATLKWFKGEILSHPIMKKYYKERHRPYVDGKRKEYRNVLLNHKPILFDNDNDDVIIE